MVFNHKKIPIENHPVTGVGIDVPKLGDICFTSPKQISGDESPS